MNLDLTGKTAVVCGSTQGIGKACAMELAALGARIVLIARNEEKLRATLEQLPNQGAGHEYLLADFSSTQQVANAIQDFTSRHTAQILVNNTGGPPPGNILQADVESFRIAFNNHLINNHVLATALIPGMISSSYGRVINVISTSVKQPLPGLGVSNTIRAAVANWAKTLAGEVAVHGITVNNVLPGATQTPRLEQIMNNKSQKSGKTIDEIESEMTTEIPMKRLAHPHEIAHVVAFLATEAASYITGINLPVDGGRTSSL
jgi:3-oxoacyl-[acyl-carrier protein] reductase